MTLEQEIHKLEESYNRFYTRYSVIANEPVFSDNPMKQELMELISDFLHHTSLLIRARREELATMRSE